MYSTLHTVLSSRSTSKNTPEATRKSTSKEVEADNKRIKSVYSVSGKSLGNRIKEGSMKGEGKEVRAVFKRVVRKAHSDKLLFEWRPEGDKKGSHRASGKEDSRQR